MATRARSCLPLTGGQYAPSVCCCVVISLCYSEHVAEMFQPLATVPQLETAAWRASEE